MTPEERIQQLERAIQNCYTMAVRKRAIRQRLDRGGKIVQTYQLSSDQDWDHIARFCREAGVNDSFSITREGT